jgi:hypothetical protein
MPGFMDVVGTVWNIECTGDSAKVISTKFKLLRKALRNWSTSISVINKIINNCNEIILLLDGLEEQRTLHISEWNFRNIVKARMQHFVNCKMEYWKKRCTARWAKLANENTSYFHSMATIRFRKMQSLLFQDQMVQLLMSIMKKQEYYGNLTGIGSVSLLQLIRILGSLITFSLCLI